mgnify:CR=1 FL=1
MPGSLKYAPFPKVVNVRYNYKIRTDMPFYSECHKFVYQFLSSESLYEYGQDVLDTQYF